MKKLTHGLGVVAIGIISATAFSGCSSTPSPTPPATGGTGTTGGTVGTGGTGGLATGGSSGASAAGTTGVGGGVQLMPTASYTLLTGADAAAGPAAAPAAWDASQCSTCHGPHGEGTIVGPEIRHTPTAYATWVVRHGRPYPPPGMTVMIAFPQTTTDPLNMPAISDADLTAVLAWLDGQPKPTTGQGLYKDFCGNCHGPSSPTGGIIPISIQGKPMSDIDTKVRAGFGTDQSMRNLYMPSEDTTALTDAELLLIKQFVGATPG